MPTFASCAPAVRALNAVSTTHKQKEMSLPGRGVAVGHAERGGRRSCAVPPRRSTRPTRRRSGITRAFFLIVPSPPHVA